MSDSENQNENEHKGSWLSSTNTRGEYVRKESPYRNWLTEADVEPGRYALYVSYACPWAHRTLIGRALKGLEAAIDVVVVDWFLGDGGWKFTGPEECPGATPDFINGKDWMREVYLQSNPEHDGNITVPVLWDKTEGRIVNNESSEILRMLGSVFNGVATNPELDLYPEDMRAAIDEANDWVYPAINNGVYRCGFAQSQEAYDEAFDTLFAALDRAEEVLGRQRYIAGDRFTEADVRLFTTLIRFDAIYVQHFKTNQYRIADKPNLLGYVREIYQMPGVADTVNLEHIKKHYAGSHTSINPLGIIPRGPGLPDYTAAHGRGE